MKKILFKSSFIFLLVFTFLLIVYTIRHFIILSSPDYIDNTGFNFSKSFFICPILYFLVMTYISHLNYKKKEDITIFVLIFIMGILPSAFIFSIVLRYLFDMFTT